MATIDFSGRNSSSDGPIDVGTGAYTTQPFPGATSDPIPANTPIGTGPITTQPQPRATTNTPTVPGTISPYDAVQQFYQSALGRQGSFAEINGWLSGAQNNIPKIQQGIYGSPEAQAYSLSRQKASTPQLSAADFIRQWQSDPSHRATDGVQPLLAAMQAAGYSNVSPYMYGQQASNNEITLDGQKFKVLGAEGTPGAYWYTGGSDSGGGGGFDPSALGYNDPSAQIYLKQLTDRLNTLNNPQPDPLENLLKLAGLQRIQDLNGAPYTGAEDAAMVAHYREPLTQARDAALLRNKEALSQRGMAASSGLLDVMNRHTENDYEKNLATGTNNLAVQAVNAKQQRADQQLSILNSLLGVSRTGVDRTNANADRAVTIASMFPQFDQQRLDMLLKASGENPSATGTMANLNSLSALGLNTAVNQNNQDAANSQFWGQLIASLVGNL